MIVVMKGTNNFRIINMCILPRFHLSKKKNFFKLRKNEVTFEILLFERKRRSRRTKNLSPGVGKKNDKNLRGPRSDLDQRQTPDWKEKKEKKRLRGGQVNVMVMVDYRLTGNRKVE